MELIKPFTGWLLNPYEIKEKTRVFTERNFPNFALSVAGRRHRFRSRQAVAMIRSPVPRDNGIWGASAVRVRKNQ